ncbi:MAG TPA: tRNA (adenosine(37)-N6)-threonylcarbamoyltransferase complex dimerization subunit type 1 TsaB [Ramlibacter sp.]|nr:tRNA (adenosine(37)-N6)-threonylcarbamoyltransferase complex dimerization subunit type 1 TsaB [Ramlibacter sp.]
MNLLAFDTSTETLRAAALRSGTSAIEQEGAGGAQASACLLPLLQSLLARAGLALRDLDAIVFGRGPGSFTGLRTACSVAQGLAFGANVPVLGIDTLLAVAEDARRRCGASRVVALLDARMGEIYMGHYVHDGAAWQRDGDILLARPEAVRVPEGFVLAGNAFGIYGDALPKDAPRVDAVPSATAMLRLAPALIAAGGAHDAAQALPVYIRDKVAQTTEERAQARRKT